MLDDEQGRLLSRKKMLKQLVPVYNLPSDLQAHILATWVLLCLNLPPLATSGRSPPFMQECLMLATHLSGP